MPYNSDVDVFILEDSHIDRRTLLGQLAEVGILIGREVNSVRYTVQAVAERLGSPAHPASQFLRELLAGPKRWVAGAADALLPVATAAGIRMVSVPEIAG